MSGFGRCLEIANITFKGSDAYGLFLREYANSIDREAVLEKAVAAGAKPVADAIRKNLNAIPVAKYRRLKPGEVFIGLSSQQKEDLANGFGLTSIKRDKKGIVNTKAGFAGYGRYKTRKYPSGVPNALLARAAESGSTVRIKTPFVRTAVAATRKQAVKAMGKVIDTATESIYNRR